MRVTISVLNAGAAGGDADAMARALMALRPHLPAGANLHLVLDSRLGEALDILRTGCSGWIEAGNTRVWGEPGSCCQGALLPEDVGRLRYLRCVAELEPDTVIEIHPLDGESGNRTGFPFMTEMHPLPLDVVGVSAVVHMLGRSEALQFGLPVGPPGALAAAGAGDSLSQHNTRSAGRWLVVTCGAGGLGADLAQQIAGHAHVTDVLVRRADLLGVGEPVNRAIVYVPEPGMGIGAMLALMARERGHIVASEGTIAALVPDLTLGAMLEVAFDVHGSRGMRDVGDTGVIGPPILASWLRERARGVGVRSSTCDWMHWQAAIDAELSQSLAGREWVSPQLLDGLADDIAKPCERMQRLLIDVSALAKFDAKSGIQRVVRNVLAHLEDALPPNVQPVPIAFLDDGRCFHASTFYARFKGFAYDIPGDAPLQPKPGDVFLGLDLSAHIVPFHLDRFHRLRRVGVPLNFVLYDMLPMSRPDCFDPRVVDIFRAWYEAVADIANGVICISKAVADEFRDWLDERRPSRLAPMRIGYFHLGADISGPNDDEEPGAHDLAALAPLGGHRYVLMVSTLEPRKGYAQALAAFERIWEEGNDLSLVIVGREGWLMKELADHLRTHPERGLRLHWFEGIPDAMLTQLYRNADLLLSASEGEGFGLSLIEAAQHGVPVLCRDLPVFREIAGDAASYFRGYGTEVLADAIRSWATGERAAPVMGIAWKTWQEATCGLVESLLTASPYATWTPGHHRYVFSGYDPRLAVIAGERSRGRIVTTGRAGFLMHGPYQALAAGAYRLQVRGELPDGRATGIRVEIVSGSGLHQIAADIPILLGGDAVLVDFCFALDKHQDDLEVRIVVSEMSAIEVSQVEILALDGHES